MTSALRHGAFRRIAALYAANSLLEWFGSIALMVVVYDATNSATAAAGMLLCKQVLPGLLIPSIADLLERMDVRIALALTAGAQAVAFGLLAAVGFGVAMFVLAVIAGAGSALLRGVLRASVARSLPASDLRGANALLNVIMGIFGPIAPVLAAVVIATTGAGVALLVAAAGLLVLTGAAFAMSEASIGPIEEPQVLSDDVARATVGSSNPPVVPIAWLLFLGAVVTCVSAIDEPSLLAYSRDSVMAGVSGYGAIFAVQAVGLTLGSLLFTRLLHWPMLRVYAVATTICACGFLGMAASPTIAFACAAALLVGIGAGMDWVAIVTAVQESAPAGRETSVAARIEAAGMAGPAVGILLGGLIAEVGSPRLALVASGVLALAVLLLGAALVAARTARLRSTTRMIFAPPVPGGSA